MSQALPMVYLVRHGETAWTLTTQHTGRTDLPLNEQGERQAGDVLAVRWIELPSTEGRRLLFATASLIVLGYDHDTEPVIHPWNGGGTAIAAT